MDPSMVDRARGCLLGAAIGDAFGMPLEGKPPRTPSDYVREFVQGRLPAGHFTDDTEMMLALAESLVACRPLDPDDLAERFAAWFRAAPRDVGRHTRRVLERIVLGYPWQRAVAVIEDEMPESEPNGSIMRCFPVAIAHWNTLSACIHDSQLQSRVTHPHADCEAAAAFTNAVIWHELREERPGHAVAAAKGDLPDLAEELRELIDAAPDKTAEDLRNSGWVRHTLESAVWGLLTSRSFEETVIRVANLGRDADSAAAVAAAMAGAAYGLSGIPPAWADRVHGEWPIRSRRIIWSRQLRDLADVLTGAMAAPAPG